MRDVVILYNRCYRILVFICVSIAVLHVRHVCPTARAVVWKEKSQMEAQLKNKDAELQKQVRCARFWLHACDFLELFGEKTHNCMEDWMNVRESSLQTNKF